MSFELVQIGNLRAIQSKDKKSQYHILNLKVTLTASVFLDASAIMNAGLYEKFEGRPALLACYMGVRDGRPSLMLENGARPFTPPTEMLEPGSHTMSVPAVGPVDPATGEILDKDGFDSDVHTVDDLPPPVKEKGKKDSWI